MTAVLVAVGGALGATARVAIERAFGGQPEPAELPWASFLVNPLGSFLLGAIIGLSLAHGLAPEITAGAGIGFCGTFTVVGPVTYDSLRLATEGHGGRAVANLVLGVALPVAAAAAGLAVTGGL